jgi:hypothetical protein
MERSEKQYVVVELEKDYSAVLLIGNQAPVSESAIVS